MIKISDAELMAYADGVLPRHLRPLVRQALLREPELLEKLESYIITNRGLAAPFARLPPLPDRLVQMLARGDKAPPPAGLRPPLLRPIGRAKTARRRPPAGVVAGSGCAFRRRGRAGLRLLVLGLAWHAGGGRGGRRTGQRRPIAAGAGANRKQCRDLPRRTEADRDLFEH